METSQATDCTNLHLSDDLIRDAIAAHLRGLGYELRPASLRLYGYGDCEKGRELSSFQGHADVESVIRPLYVWQPLFPVGEPLIAAKESLHLELEEGQAITVLEVRKPNGKEAIYRCQWDTPGGPFGVQKVYLNESELCDLLGMKAA